MGWWMVTSFVPSGNVPSTWISPIISPTPSITASIGRIVGPILVISAADLPSRMSSRSSAVISATASGWLSFRPRARRFRASSPALKMTSLSISRGVRCTGAPSPVTVVALLTPRVAVVVVAERLPESALIPVHEAELPDPLRALPEVEVRHEKTRRAAVLGRERRAIIFDCHPCLAAGDVGERQVGRVPPVGHREHVRRQLHTAREGFLEQRVHGDALPDGVQLGPLGDAMDVGRDGLVRECVELLPRPARLQPALTTDREIPRSERRVRRGTGREHREVPRFVLAGREPAGRRVTVSSAPKSSRDERVSHDSVTVLPSRTTGARFRAPVALHQNPAKPCGLL